MLKNSTVIAALLLAVTVTSLNACGDSGRTGISDVSQGPEILGKAVDESGLPLQGVTVELRPGRGVETREVWPEPIRSSASGSDGVYRLRAPAPGSWDVVLSADERMSVFCRLRPLYEDVVVPPVQVPPKRMRTLRLLDPDGRPTAGTALVQGSRRSEAGPLSPIQCSPELRFVTVDPSGEAQIRAAADEHLTVLASSEVGVTYGASKPGETIAEITLDGSFRRARLVDVEGEPLAGMDLILPPGLPLGVSGPDGEARIPRLHDGRMLSVAVFGNSEFLGMAEVADEETSRESLLLELQPAFAQAGTVVDLTTGRPIPGAWVALGSETFSPADESGRFQAVRSFGTSRTLWGVAPGYVAGKVELQVDDGDGRQTLRLERAGTLTGRVVDENGAPLAAVEILAIPDGRAPKLKERAAGSLGLLLHMPTERSAQSDGEGRFEVDGLTTDATYFLRVRLAGFAEERVSIKVEGDTAGPTVVLRSGFDALGRVVDQNDSPIADAEVQLIEEPAPGDSTQLRVRPTRMLTDADGRFRFRDLSPRAYQILVTSRGYSPTYQRLIRLVTKGPAEDLGNIRLLEGARMEGQVVDASGVGLKGARIDASLSWSLPAANLQGISTVTDSDGRYALTGVPLGEISARVFLDGYAGQSRRLQSPEDLDSVNFVLTSAKNVAIRVLDPQGRPLPNAQLRLRRPDDGTVIRPTSSQPSQGWYWFKEQAPGRVVVSVQSDLGVADDLVFEIPEQGKPAAQTIRLRRSSGR